jgi:two-component system, NtrC family, sensor kinase
MTEITAGNLEHVLPLGRGGEIGQIAYLFNEMTSRLRAAQNEVAESAATKLSLEARVHHSEKLATLGQLAAEIAHEIGTPLSVIGGRAANITRKIEQPAEVTKNAEIIATQVNRITNIIRQMLDFAGKAPLRRRPSDVVEIFQNTVALIEDRLTAPHIEIVWSIAPEIPRIPVDAESIEQVALNLVINAIHAMPEGGRLTIRAAIEPHRKGGLESIAPTPHLVVTVEDNGVGIPEDIQPRIFEAFFSTKAKGEGTGLGLTVAMNIIKAHDGWIEVKGVEPRGTAFRVFLPAELDPTAPHGTTGPT